MNSLTTNAVSKSHFNIVHTLILIIFFLSGAASLIYQVSWQRILTLYYGVGHISMSIIITIFMTGLGFGSLLGGRLAEKLKNRLLLYFILEMGIGIFGLCSIELFKQVLPWLSSLTYFSGSLLITSVLIIPILLMGMTLPLVIKILNKIDHNFGHTFSLLYFTNTLGAAFGAFFGTYGLISFFGLKGAVYIAASINIGLCGLISTVLYLDKKMPLTLYHESVFNNKLKEKIICRKSIQDYCYIFLTGFLAIGYQIIWFRVLGVLLKPSTYVFSTILAIYLFALALGSYIMSNIINRINSSAQKELFFKINFCIAIIVLITFGILYQFCDNPVISWLLNTTFNEELHPGYHPMYAIRGDSLAEWWTSIYLASDILLWPLLIVFPATILIGASFPLIATTVIGADQREGFKSGLVYSIMVLGNILGSLLTAFILLPKLGTEFTLLLFVCIGIFWLLGIRKIGSRTFNAKYCFTFIICLVCLAWTFMPKYHQFYSMIHPKHSDYKQIITEDVDGVIVGYHRKDDIYKNRTLIYINGSSHASYPSAAYHLQAYEATSRAKTRKEALVIGVGGGDIAHFLLKTPNVEHITIVEISPALIKNLKENPFYNEILFNNPKVELHIEDARRFLMNLDKKYDIITMDPLRSTSAYSNNIYSHEFFSIVKEHMKDTGVFVSWFNEYEIIPRTIASVFDQMQCFDCFCVSSIQPMTLNTELQAKLWNSIIPPMQKGMLKSIEQDYYSKGNREEMLKKIYMNRINTDLNPITEFYFGYNLKRYYGLL